MSSNTENTEAKLAAYIDGQLDPAERAQIEQYLQSNPEHRKLLADLIAQRETLRSLPRENAPPDVYDAIQAQLERSVLLDDSAASAAPILRHSRRSQLVGLAAMLLLAVGLGVVLYFALPSTKPHPIDVASTAGSAASQPTTLAAADTDVDGVLSAPAGSVAVAKRRAKSAPTLAYRLNAHEQTAIASNTPSSDRTLRTLRAAAGPQPQDLAKAAGVTASAAAPPSPGQAGQVLLLVSTDDPSQVNQQVESYLQSNHIRWDAVRAPADQVFYSRSATAAPVPTQKLEIARVADEGNLGAPAPADATERTRSNDGQKQSAAPAEAPPLATAPDESQSVQPEQQPQPTSSPVPSENRKQEAPPPPTTAQSQQVATLSPAAGQADTDKGASRPSYIVARGMTREQAIELTDTLSVDRTRQRARLIGQFPAHTMTAKALQVGGDESKLAQTQPAPQAQPTTEPSATTRPTTDPAQQDEDAASKQPVVAAAPTTATILSEKAQSSATTLPTTQTIPTVDVVILVEDDAPFPTTAPAAPAASQPAAPATQPNAEQ